MRSDERSDLIKGVSKEVKESRKKGFQWKKRPWDFEREMKRNLTGKNNDHISKTIPIYIC